MQKDYSEKDEIPEGFLEAILEMKKMIREMNRKFPHCIFNHLIEQQGDDKDESRTEDGKRVS